MNVPFIDFSKQNEMIRGEVDAGWQDIISRSSFIMGSQVQQFEEAFAQFCGVKYCLGVNSGTDALYLSLAALDIQPGDEVILPTHTFIATALCVSYTGANVRFADIEETTYNLDPESLKKAVTPRTKAVIPVHLYGQIACMDEIQAITDKCGIAVVEDACQAHGARYKGKRSGSMGKTGCFSFYPTKGLGAWGDGGAVVTNDEKIKYSVGMLRDYGRTDRYSHKMKGFNSRLDTMQAVVLSAKLKHLNEWNQLRQKVADWYTKELSAIGVAGPSVAEGREHVFQTYAIRVQEREKVMEKLKSRGIVTLIHYPIPVHLQEAYVDAGYKKGSFPKAEKVADEILSLPFFPHMTEDQVKIVVSALKESL